MMKMKLEAILFVSLVYLCFGDKLERTQYDKYWKLECPPDQGLTGIESEYSPSYEDREFTFSCTKLSVPVEDDLPGFSGFVNDYDEPVNFECREYEIIGGVESVHNEDDRRWNFQCRLVIYGELDNCLWTFYQHDWRGPMAYVAPTDRYITGVKSVFSDDMKDRRWMVRTCRLLPPP